jgi:hypothetical protein
VPAVCCTTPPALPALGGVIGSPEAGGRGAVGVAGAPAAADGAGVACGTGRETRPEAFRERRVRAVFKDAGWYAGAEPKWAEQPATGAVA